MNVADPIIEVTDGDFYQNVLQKSHELPVVVDFWSENCPPCRLLGPLLEKLVRERQGQVLLAKANVEETPQVANHFGIQVVPTVIAFKDGQPGLEFRGLLPEHQLRQFLDEISPSEADQQVSAAKEQAAKDPAEAEREYREILEKEPNHDEALVGLAELLVKRGDFDEADKLLENATTSGQPGATADRLRGEMFFKRLAQKLEPLESLQKRRAGEPENTQVQYELGLAQAAAGKYEEALATLMSAGERDFNLAGSKVRPAMVHIFHIIGERSELADQYRRKLTSLLY
ncbi:MAG: tetratricopeptide repeat protein [Gemmataceae bacterium]